MEKIGTLIKKLQEQYASQVNAEFLLHTTEMLVAELSMQHHQQQVKKRVAVLMPQHFVANHPISALPIEEKEFETTVVDLAKPATTVEIPSTQNKEIEIVALPKMEEKEAEMVIEELIAEIPKPILQKPLSIFNTEVTQPIVNGHKMLFELNDVLVEDEEEINQKHQTQQIEVAATIKQPPVKDLRKAIGINDKYAFIQYLFKGDEATYERCIKTINGFNVFPEAEAWVKRELITKMGWVEEEETVQTFLYLVKRRFA